MEKFSQSTQMQQRNLITQAFAYMNDILDEYCGVLELYSRQQCVNMYKEFKFLNCNACKATQWTNDVDDYDGLDKSPSKKKIGGRNFIPGDVDDYNASNTPFHFVILKFILLLDCSTLEAISKVALLAARNSSAVVFIGTFGALAFGDTDLPVDDIAAVCLLVTNGFSDR
ncbi:hypothetical protein LOK49_Contig4G00005 [Camellia lanceoleosa]|nr:hypothetical protein LOK49_Contig4G00005 [Camellia lanceoleosa]